MKMEVLAVQQQYQSQYGVLGGSNKINDWTSTLTPPSSATQKPTTTSITATTTTVMPPYRQSNTTNKIKNSISKKTNRTSEVSAVGKSRSAATVAPSSYQQQQQQQQQQHQQQQQQLMPNSSSGSKLFYCDDIDAAAVNELSLRLLDELRAAKSRHLTCTEVSLPCDLTPRIAAEIIRVSEKEPCGIRGCTIYIEFEDEPNNSRRIASLKLDNEMVSTFEVYLTLRQDHRGWTALLPQFMKSLARTITISPEFTITKHKLYTPQERSSSYSYGSGNSRSAAISTPSS